MRKEDITKVTTVPDEELFIVRSKYANNKAMAISLYCADGEPYDDITVNIVGVSDTLPDGQVLIDSWNSSKDFLEQMLESGYFTDTGIRIPVGGFDAQAHVWQVVKDITDVNLVFGDE